MKKAWARFDMIYVSSPRFIHNMGESQHFCPKILKTEGLGLLRAAIICKNKRAMIGKDDERALRMWFEKVTSQFSLQKKCQA
jgi:hypothetical protein